jgi:hypothetical protein
MPNTKRLLIGIVILLFSSAFTLTNQQGVINYQKLDCCQFNQDRSSRNIASEINFGYLNDSCKEVNSLISQSNHSRGIHSIYIEAENFMESVILDALCILGAQPARENFDRTYGDEARRLSFSVKGSSGGEFIIENQDMYVDSNTFFLGYPAYQDSERLIWGMEGYTFWVFTPSATQIQYAEALHEAYWNVKKGTPCEKPSSASNPTLVPQNIPSSPTTPPDNPCLGVECTNNYCSEDGTKFLYDCACDPQTGGCSCRYDECLQGCDDALGGCVMQQFDDLNDLCAGVVCSPDYCEEDQRTRMFDCKCDPQDGYCYCDYEICPAGCNIATGRCVESITYDDDSSDLLEALGIIGGVAVGGGTLIGGGYLGIKALKSTIAKRAVKPAVKPAVKVAEEPTLREAMAEMNKWIKKENQALDKIEAKLNKDLRESNLRSLKLSEDFSQHMDKRAAFYEKAEDAVKIVKKGADVTAGILEKVPGAGDAFKAIYDYSTTAAESIASGDSIGEVILKSASKVVENKVSGALFSKATTMQWLPTNKFYGKTVKQAYKQIGGKRIVVEALKNEGVEGWMNVIKEVKTEIIKESRFADVGKRVGTVAKRIDRKGLGRMAKNILYGR